MDSFGGRVANEIDEGVGTAAVVSEDFEGVGGWRSGFRQGKEGRGR